MTRIFRFPASGPFSYWVILLVDGNPLEDVTLLGENGKSLSLIMKDGAIYKNTIDQP